MSPEPQQSPNEWNSASLYAHFNNIAENLRRYSDQRHHDIEKATEVRFQDLQAQIDRRLETQLRERHEESRLNQERIKAAREHSDALITALATAVEKFEQHVKDRLEQLNKLREQALADRAQYATKESTDAKIDALDVRLQAVREDMTDRLPLSTWESTVAEWTRWRNEIDRVIVRQPEYQTAESEWGDWQKSVEERLNIRAGGEDYEHRRVERMQPWMIWAAGAVLAVLIVGVNFVVA